MGKIVLVTGGARSGKSQFAEKYAAKYGKKVAYIATAEIYDKEMQFRVDLHQKRRPADWQTYEAPFKAHEAIRKAGNEHDMILFDCITLYISNMLCHMENIEDSAVNYRVLEETVKPLIEAARENKGTTIFVTNEVGSGIVPENYLSREYRDLSGLANQWLGKAADEVYLVTCGIAVDVKKIQTNL